MRSAPPVRALHSPEHQLLDPSTVVHPAYVSEQSQFPAYQFLISLIILIRALAQLVNVLALFTTSECQLSIQNQSLVLRKQPEKHYIYALHSEVVLLFTVKK